MNNDIRHLPNGDFEVVKTCNRCFDDLPLDKYYRDRHSKDGHQHRCISCQIETYHDKKCRQVAELLRNWRTI